MGSEDNNFDYKAMGKSVPKENFIVKDGSTVIALDYYTRPFMLLHSEYMNSSSYSVHPHNIRTRFWRHALSGTYDQEESIGLLLSYLDTVERYLSTALSKHSIAYWLHVYRRLFPGPISRDNRPQSIGLTRAVFEAAFQKLAPFKPCNGIGASKEIEIGEVLGGLLIKEEFSLEREILENSGNQLVLTNFTSQDLREFYDIEKLAYEIWRTGAMLRIVGKGAQMVVGNPPEYMWDNRSDELDTLIRIYDERYRGIDTTSIGVYYEPQTMESDGVIFLPTYNLGGITSNGIKPLIRRFYNREIIPELGFNFVWLPVNLRAFRNAHAPLAEAFTRKYGVTLDLVLIVIAALSCWQFSSWIKPDYSSFIRSWQRAYDGPFEIQNIRDAIATFLPNAARVIGIGEQVANAIDIDEAISFWDLASFERSNIDLAYSGPHFVFLPFGKNRRFIDYAWIIRRLYDLFVGVWISDQNFKADALEIATGRDSSILPTGPCKSLEGSQRQIDFAASVDYHLVIAECKAVSRSIAFDRGDPQAIKYRHINVVEKSLLDADEKARWLAKNPVGTNYNISRYKDILPVGISPFVEYIPSLDQHYWISRDKPRVMTPKELHELLTDINLIRKSFNRINIMNHMCPK